VFFAAKRYCPMLIEQGGDLVLLNLIRHPDTNSCVLALSEMVIFVSVQFNKKVEIFNTVNI
jgi:hypothetical protein